MVAFGKYLETCFLLFFVASRLHSQHSPHLWYFLCLVSVACLKVLKSFGFVPVSCVVASLAFPASSALGHEKQESVKKALLYLQKHGALLLYTSVVFILVKGPM